MPVIVFLPTVQQVARVTALANHIQKKVTDKKSPLRSSFIFDEADKVYPPLRDRFKDILGGSAVDHYGFVSATDGDLMDQDYPECANAQLFQPGEGDPNYRAFHLADAEIHYVPHKSKDGNDAYAESILTDPANKDYVFNKFALPSGEMVYRKFIVNGPSKTEHMRDFATKRVAAGCNAITVNMYGIKVYRPNFGVVTYSSKGMKFNKVIFDIYNQLKLGDAPLFIVGRRKIDRGVGFHYAPRPTLENPIAAPGLIWTDMILGRIDDTDQAVQKAGRLAGIIAGNPQYPGKIHYWTDESTARAIRKHNEKVDLANKQPGCSALQATERAKAEIARIAAALPPVEVKTFRLYPTEAALKDALKDAHPSYAFRKRSYDQTRPEFLSAACGGPAAITSLEHAAANVHNLTGGKGKSATSTKWIPVYRNTDDASTLLYMLILPEGITEEHLKALDAKHERIQHFTN
jgi:hypothetical protein